MRSISFPPCLFCWLCLGLLLGGCTNTSPKNAGAPASIVDVGEYGENIYDAVRENNWTVASQKFAELSQAADKLAQDIPNIAAEQKMARSRLTGNLAAMKASIASKDKKATLQTANDVTLVGEQLSVSYSPIVPLGVTHLDYLGRELVIWSAANNLPRLQRLSAEINATWDTVEPMIEAKGKTALAKSFTDLVAKVGSAQTAQEYQASAGPLLDEVDNLEKVFK